VRDVSIYLVTALNIVNGVCLRASRVLMSLFAIQLGAGAFEIGVLIALSSAFQLFLGIPAGQFADRFGFRRPMLLGAAGGSTAMIVPYLFPSMAGLYVSRALTGMTFIFFAIAVQTLAASLGGPDKRAANLTTFSLGQAVAGLLGPILIGFAIDRVGHASSYLVLAVLALLPAAALTAFPSIVPAPRAKQKAEARENVFALLKLVPLRRALFTGAIVFAGGDLLSFYVPIYGNSIGLSATMIGIILGAHSAAAFVVRLIMPAFLKKMPAERVLCMSLVAAGLTYVLIPLFENAWILAAVSFLLGLGLGCGQPLTMMLIYERTPSGRAGAAMGLRMSINKIIQIGVPLGFGYLGSLLGLKAVFWTNAALVFSGGNLNRASGAKPRKAEPS
jgi:MFS family permease